MMPRGKSICRRSLCLVFFMAGLVGQSVFALPKDWEEKALSAIEQGQFTEAVRLSQEALQEPRFAVQAHQILGRALTGQGKWAEAISHFESASTGGIPPMEIKMDWVKSLTSLRREEQACTLMEGWLSADPEQGQIRVKLGELYLLQKKGQQAATHLEEAQRLGVDEKTILLPLAKARFMVREDDRTVAFLEAAGQRLADPELLLGIGQLLLQHLYYRQAICPLRKAWRQKPGSYEVGMYLATSYYLIREYNDSARVLKSIRPGASSPLDYLVLGGCVAARLGQWEEGEKELRNTLQQYPDRAEGYLNLGLFYLERDRHQQARAMLEKGSTLIVKGTKILYFIPPPENFQQVEPPPIVRNKDVARGEFYCQLAEMLQNSKQEGTALEVYRLALEVDNSSPRACLGIGRVCFDLDKPDTARLFAERGLELSPAIPELHFLMGLIRQYSIQNIEAARNYQKAIELKGTNVPALYWVQLGTAQIGQAPPLEREGEDSFLQALKIDPVCAQAHYQLGRLYFNRGNYRRAAEWLEQAVRYDPDLVQAYFQYGQACLQNGEEEKGKRLLETFRRRRALAENLQVCVDPGLPQ
jgi:tetratricopeptide (TPR) repeat protein